MDMAGSVNKVTDIRLDVEIVNKYENEQLSIPQIARQLDLPPSRIRQVLVDSDVPRRSRTDGIRLRTDAMSEMRRGKKRPPFSEQWRENISKGKLAHGERHAKGTTLKPDGYVEYTRGPNKFRSVHVVAMEQRLGRHLTPDECVHHIDGDRSNNDPNNLALVTRSGHTRLHRYEEKLSGKQTKRGSDGRFI
jgi:hypothetical protein